MSKYEPVWEYLQTDESDTLKLSFKKIKNIPGFEIDHSFLTYKKESAEFGYQVGKISLKENMLHSIK